MSTSIKFYVLVCLLGASACNTPPAHKTPAAGKDLEHLSFTVAEAPEWNALFNRSSGWFGGDGIFVLPANGADTASDKDERTILFSDTMIGEIEDGQLKPGYVMIHNSVARLKGAQASQDSIAFYWDKEPGGAPESLFIPHTPASRAGDYYWLGDGFVNPADGNAYVFGYRIRDARGANPFGFVQVGNTLITLPRGSQPPFREQQQADLPFFRQGKTIDEDISFGSGIFVNTASAGVPHPDGYVYVYGVGGKDKHLMAARVLPQDFTDFNAWRFWDGSNWVNNMDRAAHLTDHVSNELSVSPLPDGRYVLFFQVDGVMPTVGMRLAASPVGPFGPVIKVFDCKSALEGPKFFTYNAKAHPALSKPGELLVSYNVNSFDFFNDIKTHPNLYRPRFIRIRY